MQKTVWETRWALLKTNGLSFEQAVVVYDLFNTTRAFGSQTIADSAWKALERVYADDGYAAVVGACEYRES